MTGFTQEIFAYSGNVRKKDYYDLIYKLIQESEYKTVLDIGCASGDFFKLLPFANVMGLGIDISKELIEKANESNNKKNISYKCVDFVCDETLKIKSFDLITILGTLAAIEDHIKFLDSVFALEPKQIVINDVFNENEIDVRCGYRRPNEGNKDFNYAYNIRSMTTIKTYLSAKLNYSAEFQPYDLETLLKPTDDPTRNYHANFNGRTVLTNGMNLVLYGYNVFITKK
jgi:SAM-dependent methyltransferase